MGGVTVEKDSFGKTSDGQNVDRYTFQNGNNVSVQVIRYGGIVTTISVPDKDDKIEDICLGFDTINEYETQNYAYFGAIVGRVANRIAKGKFTLDGVEYTLPVNNGPNSLHGGINGFDKKLWDATLDGTRLILQYVSEDGEEGYPGKVTAQVSYELTDENELYIDYTATCNKATPFMLTNHAYFNLAGQGTPDVYEHTVQLAADEYLPLDDTSIPTGVVAPVEGTGFDLRRTVRLGDRMKAVNDGKGFDNCFCTGIVGKRKFVSRVEYPKKGRFLEVYSTEPAVQFYTSYYLDGVKGKGGATYGRHAALCLETQHYPDSVNQPSFPTTILRPGETYRHRTWYKFGIII